jgi:hypothetical protein
MKDVTRAAETEAIFRDVNETVVEHHDSADPQTPILCECSNDSCAESIVVSRDDHERIRARSKRFFVRPEHVTTGIEVVVERQPDYWVIEKVGRAGEIAEETDSRS